MMDVAEGLGAAPKTPAERAYAFDPVFREVAAAILSHEYLPGAPLPAERELADRFRVSRIMVRIAMHRLKDCGLVRIRQGTSTIVLEPNPATHIDLLALEGEVGSSSLGSEAFAEHQRYSAAALIELAERRMTNEDIDALERLIDEFLRLGAQADEWPRFKRAYWTAIARGTRNRICLREALWHFKVLESSSLTGPRSENPAAYARVYKTLITTQRLRNGSAALYLAAVRRMGTGALALLPRTPSAEPCEAFDRAT
jgi:DNA-binding FadR family transcriptional regulator